MTSSHQPKAWYHATRNGRFVCHRCKAELSRSELDDHTAVCWPEVGKTSEEENEKNI
jgi:hypothetical protein